MRVSPFAAVDCQSGAFHYENDFTVILGFVVFCHVAVEFVTIHVKSRSRAFRNFQALAHAHVGTGIVPVCQHLYGNLFILQLFQGLFQLLVVGVRRRLAVHGYLTDVFCSKNRPRAHRQHRHHCEDHHERDDDCKYFR